MPKVNHIHRYRRAKNKNLYFCTKPGCFHKVQKEFLVGKLSECPSCSAPFELTSYELKLAYPRCKRCRTDIGADLYAKAKALAQTLEFPKDDEGEIPPPEGERNPFDFGE